MPWLWPERPGVLLQYLESYNQDLQGLHKDHCIIGKNKVSDLGITNQQIFNND